jgi:glutaredoxin
MSIIDIYTTPQCGFCKQLKALLDSEGKKYTSHDVTASDNDLQEMQTLTDGALSVPVVVVDKGTDSQGVAVGFEEGKELLGFSGKTKKDDGSGEMGHLTCPECQHMQEAPIPTTSCVPFYKCEGCNKTIKATGGDCCVFCSYGDKLCPISNRSKVGGCADGSCAIK